MKALKHVTPKFIRLIRSVDLESKCSTPRCKYDSEIWHAQYNDSSFLVCFKCFDEMYEKQKINNLKKLARIILREIDYNSTPFLDLFNSDKPIEDDDLLKFINNHQGRLDA